MTVCGFFNMVNCFHSGLSSDGKDFFTVNVQE